MTAEFLEGKRARYVPPARLYVFVSVIFFFLVGKFADHQLEEGMKAIYGTSDKRSDGDTTDTNGILKIDLSDLINNKSLLRSRGLYKLGKKINLNTTFSKEGLARVARRLKRLQPHQLDSLLTQDDVPLADSNRTKLRELIALVPKDPMVSIVSTDFSSMMGKNFKTEEEREKYEEKLSHMSDAQIDSLIRADGSKPNWFMRKFYQRQGKFSHLGKGENTHELIHSITKNLSVVMFVLMPFVAILLLLFYFRRGRYYYEHLIFSVHIHMVLFLLFSMALLTTYVTSPKVTSSVLLWTFWISWFYFLLSLKRVYNQSWSKTILKCLLLSMMYGFSAVLFMLGALTSVY